MESVPTTNFNGYWPIILSILLVLLAIYHYLFRSLNYFKRHGVPQIPGIPIFGNMMPVMLGRKTIAEHVDTLYSTYPEAKYMGIYDTTTPVLLIRDPQLMKIITVKSFDSFPDRFTTIDEVSDPLFGKNLASLRGDKWKEVRNLLTPAFTSSKMKAMFKLMSDCAADFSDCLSKFPEEKATMDVKDIFTRYTNDVIATCVFGVNVNSVKDPQNEFYVYGREGTNMNSMLIKMFLIRYMPRLSKFLRVRICSERVTKFFVNLIETTVRTREEQGIHRPDVIELMMESKRKGNTELTLVEMTSQAFLFFLGGFETVSTLMCFVAHELGVKPDIQRKLQEEVDSVMEENNGQLTYEAVSDMKYLDAVINETLRMYPVNVFLDRICQKRIELQPALPGGKPFVVEKGTGVWLPLYSIHRDPQYFDNPNTFDPDRFMNDGKKILNSGVYMPFGLGPRNCIGSRFALLEIKVLICHILSRCDIKRCNKTPDPMVFGKGTIFIMPVGGFWLKFQARENPSAPVKNL